MPDTLDLKSLRLAANLTQQFVADRLNCKRQDVSDWERGIHPPTSFKNVTGLCKLYNITATVLNAAIEESMKNREE